MSSGRRLVGEECVDNVKLALLLSNLAVPEFRPHLPEPQSQVLCIEIRQLMFRFSEVALMSRSSVLEMGSAEEKTWPQPCCRPGS